MIVGIAIGFFLALAIYGWTRKKMAIGESFVFSCPKCGKGTSVSGCTYYLHEFDNTEPIEVDCMTCDEKNIGSHMLWDRSKENR